MKFKKIFKYLLIPLVILLIALVVYFLNLYRIKQVIKQEIQLVPLNIAKQIKLQPEKKNKSKISIGKMYPLECIDDQTEILSLSNNDLASKIINQEKMIGDACKSSEKRDYSPNVLKSVNNFCQIQLSKKSKDKFQKELIDCKIKLYRNRSELMRWTSKNSKDIDSFIEQFQSNLADALEERSGKYIGNAARFVFKFEQIRKFLQKSFYNLFIDLALDKLEQGHNYNNLSLNKLADIESILNNVKRGKFPTSN